MIFCDFRKAFDTVPHHRLIDVLRFYGIEGPLLSWIQDFLTGRKQNGNGNGKTSKKFDVT